MITHINPTVTFYTAGGEPIDNDELYLHDLTAGMVSFSGAEPVTVREFSINETKTVQAWLQFLPGLSPSRVRSAVSELADRGLVQPTGETRPTRYGRRAQVWEVAA